MGVEDHWILFGVLKYPGVFYTFRHLGKHPSEVLIEALPEWAELELRRLRRVGDGN